MKSSASSIMRNNILCFLNFSTMVSTTEHLLDRFEGSLDVCT